MPRRAPDGPRSKDVSCARHLFVDFDGIGPDVAGDRWRRAGLSTPALTTASRRGVHTYWRLAGRITDIPNMQRATMPWLTPDAGMSKHKGSLPEDIPAGSRVHVFWTKCELSPAYLWRDPGLLNGRLVPVTFDVPLDVFNSPLSSESANFPSKLVSNSWSPN